MIIAPQFQGDDDESVMVIQHSVYGRAVGSLAGELIRAYCFASGVTEGGVETASRLLELRTRGIDHRVVQRVHDQMAGHYRKTHQASLQPALSLEGEESEADRIRQQWLQWWDAQVQMICDDVSLLKAGAECIATSWLQADDAKEEAFYVHIEECYPT